MQPHAEGEDSLGQLRAQGGGVMQALPQLECCQHCPPGMILLGHGRAKHGREAFTRHEGEGARIVVQHLLGQSHHRLEQPIQPLRAQPRRQGGRLGQRTADDGDQLVFRLQSGAGGRRLGRLEFGRGRERGPREDLRDGQRRWRIGDGHRGDEPIALPMHGRNVSRRLGDIAEHVANLMDAGGERPIADDHVRPDGLQKGGFAHQAARVGD